MSLSIARKNLFVGVAVSQGRMKRKQNDGIDTKYQNVIRLSAATVVYSLATSPATVRMQQCVSIVEKVDIRETPVLTRIRRL